jgi:hypothetical protein
MSRALLFTASLISSLCTASDAAPQPRQAGPTVSAAWTSGTVRADCVISGGRVLSFRIEVSDGQSAHATGPRCPTGVPESGVVSVYELQGPTWQSLFTDAGRGYRPWKLVLCELDGDSLPEVALGVYKSTRLDPAECRRLFIFDWTREDVLVPLWLGSRLSFELDDFGFLRGPDGLDVLVAAEHRGADGCVLREYQWRGFGFLAIGDRMKMDGPCHPDATAEACRRALGALLALPVPEGQTDARSWRRLTSREGCHAERGTSLAKDLDVTADPGQTGE